VKRRKLLGNLLALAIGLAIAVGGAELYLRLTDNSTNNYGTTLRYAANPELGYTLEPNQDAVVHLPCTRIEHVRVNSLGFRDHEWSRDSSAKIAVLGDSFMEGVHLADSDHVSGILEQLLGVEVMNFGISGYGTVAHLMTYRKVVRQFHPKVVLLFFFTQNDFLNDHCALDVRTGNFRAQPCPCGMIKNGKVSYHLDHPPGIVPLLPPEPTGFHVYDYLSSKFRKPVQIESAIWPQYLPPWKGEYNEALAITRQALRDLKTEVEADGAKLIVVSVPPYLDLLGDQYEQEVRDVTGWDTVPDDWDSRHPLRLLDSITRESDIDLLAMEDLYADYLQHNPLPYPLLCFRCDGHHNPVGHWLMAHHSAKALLSYQSLGKDSSELSILNNRIENHLQMGPKDILGETAYRQIYESGAFEGKTEIATQVRK
jgi:hypothetical protein